MTEQINGYPYWYGPQDYQDFPIRVKCFAVEENDRLEWCLHNLPRGAWCFDPYINRGTEYRFKNPDDATIFKLKFG